MMRRLLRYFIPNPAMGAGFWLIVIGLGLASCPTKSMDLPQRSERTSSWYANPRNADVLDFVTRRCADDPGHLRNDPDCINAARGRALAAEAEARRNLHDRTPASSSDYWVRRPIQRQEMLTWCSRLTREEQIAMRYCDPAAAAQPTRRSRT